MPRSYADYYRQKQEYLTEQVEHGNVLQTDAEAIRELCNAFDEDRPTTQRPHWPNAPSHLTKYRSDSTLANWMYHLTQYAQELSNPLTDTSARQLNRVAEDWLNGQADHKNKAITKGSIRAYQNSARIFYRYHDTEVDASEIAVFEQNDKTINPRDMLTSEEVEKARQAPEHARDKCIFYMLLYTGLRNNGLRTLRIKDIDVENAEWYFNTNSDHLKNIHKPNSPRPLLGAVAAVREWLSYHPFGDDPDAYLIVGKPKYGNVDPHTTVGDRTIQRVMDSIKEDTGIEKPMHPHMMRHNFVSICKRNYDLDNDTIKFLIGHSPDSNVMETTYSHLSGEDYKKKAEVGAGQRDPDEDSPHTPKACPACGEPLATEAKACPSCGMVITPDAHSTLDKLNDAMFEGRGETESEDEDEAVAKFHKFVRDNPEVKQLLLDKE